MFSIWIWLFIFILIFMLYIIYSECQTRNLYTIRSIYRPRCISQVKIHICFAFLSKVCWHPFAFVTFRFFFFLHSCQKFCSLFFNVIALFVTIFVIATLQYLIYVLKFKLTDQHMWEKSNTLPTSYWTQYANIVNDIFLYSSFLIGSHS